MPSRVLITGLNGFVAVHTAVKFLNEGWIVRGTVRSSSKAESTKTLNAFKEYVDNGRLEVAVVADLGNDDLSKVLDGVDAVAHLAAPFQFNLGSWAEHRDGAVKNTLHVLEEANKCPTVKNFVLLSSFVSINESDKPYKDFAGVVYNEDKWYSATEEDCEALKESDPGAAVVWYCASKKFQEIAAVDFVKQQKPSWKLSVLCPSFVLGAPLEINTAQELESAPGVSTQTLRAVLCSNGADVPETQFPAFVDVRDVAAASHLAISKGTEGRFLVTSGLHDTTQMVRSAVRQFPELKDKFAKADLGEGPTPVQVNGCFVTDNSRSREILGLKYHTLDELVADVVRKYKELGVY